MGLSRRSARLLARLGLVVAALGACEGGFRLWLRSTGAPYDARATGTRLRARLRQFSGETFLDRARPADEASVAQDAGRLPHPYYAWQTARGVVELEERLRAAPEEGEWLVWIVGGSVAGIFANPGSGLEPLVERLERDPRLAGRRVVVHNYARAAYKQPQQLTLVAHLFSLGLRPDAVINLDGFNEVAIGNMNAVNGADPTFPDLTQWGSLALARDEHPQLAEAEEELRTLLRRVRRLGGALISARLYGSALVGTFAEKVLGHYAWKRGKLETAYKEELLALGSSDTLRGPGGGLGGGFGGGAEHGASAAPEALAGARALDAIVTSWVESSRSLDALCAARGVVYLHVLQPTLHDEGSKPLTREEIEASRVRPSWREGARAGYPRLRAAAPALRAAGVAFVDASDVFAGVSDTLYYDACHFGREGNVLLAERVAEGLLSAMER